MVIYYERLWADFDSEIRRLNDFLGLPKMSNAKLSAVREASTVRTMKMETCFDHSEKHGVLVGDWKKYLDKQHWDELDRVAYEQLKGVGIAKPLLSDNIIK